MDIKSLVEMGEIDPRLLSTATADRAAPEK
jgi:hypothetical protein